MNRIKAINTIKIAEIIISIALFINIFIFQFYESMSGYYLYIPNECLFIPFIEAFLYFVLLVIEAALGSIPIGRFLTFGFVDLVAVSTYTYSTNYRLLYAITVLCVFGLALIIASAISLFIRPKGKKINGGASLPRLIFSKTSQTKRNCLIVLWFIVSIVIPVFIILLSKGNIFIAIGFAVIFALGYLYIIVKTDDVITAMFVFRKNASFEEFCKRINKLLHNDLESDSALYAKAVLLTVYTYYDSKEALLKFADLARPGYKKMWNSYYTAMFEINLTNGNYDEAKIALGNITHKQSSAKANILYKIYTTKDELDLSLFKILPKMPGVTIFNAYSLMNYYYLRDNLAEAKKYANIALDCKTDLIEINNKANEILNMEVIAYS